MGIWILMIFTNLLIPLIMIGFGSYFAKNAPKNINHFIGYRTSMSMKNNDTWEFAHHYCGKLWRVIGFFMLIGTVIAMLFSLGKSSEFVGLFGIALCLIQTVILILSIIPTESALKKTFDKNGNRKQQV